MDSHLALYRIATTLPLELPPTMMRFLVDGWKHVRLMTDVNDSPVTARRSLPLESKISMQRGLFMLPEQKMSSSGCQVAWNVVSQRPVWLLCRMLWVGLMVLSPLTRCASSVKSKRFANDVVSKLFPLGEKKALLTDKPAICVPRAFGDLEEFLESLNFRISNKRTAPSVPHVAKVFPLGWRLKGKNCEIV